MITIFIYIGLIFFLFAVWAYLSYRKNMAIAKSKETEAYSWWTEITNGVKKLSDNAYNELSALHEARVRPTVKHVMVDFASIIQAAKGKGIILDAIQCPYCGAAVNIPTSGEYFYCKYCGKTIHATKVFDKLRDILSPP
jgi:ribosomal protein S27AE